MKRTNEKEVSAPIVPAPIGAVEPAGAGVISEEVSAPIVPAPIGAVEPAGAEVINEGVLAAGEAEAVGMGGVMEGESRGIKRRRSDSEGEGSAWDSEGEGSAWDSEGEGAVEPAGAAGSEK